MSFINAVKLALSRSGLLFKILLYDIIVLVVILSACAGVLISEIQYVSSEIGQLDIVNKLTEGIREYLSGNELTLGDSLQSFYDAIAQALNLISSNVFNTAYIAIGIALIVSRFIFGLRTLPTYDIMNRYMSEGSNYYFMSTYVSTFGKSARFATFQTLFTLPFDVLICAAGYFLIGFLFKTLGILAPFIVIIVVICLIALRYTLFFFWGPLVVRGMPIVKAFGEGIKLGFKNFGDIFSLMVVYLVLMFSVMSTLLFSTYGVGLLIALPLSFVFMVALNLVKYYDVARLRYYVTADTVVNPPVVEEFEITDKESDLIADEFEDEEESGENN